MYVCILVWVKGGEGRRPWAVWDVRGALLPARARTVGSPGVTVSDTSRRTVKEQSERLILVRLQNRRTEGSVAASHCPRSPYRLHRIFQVVLL